VSELHPKDYALERVRAGESVRPVSLLRQYSRLALVDARHAVLKAGIAPDVAVFQLVFHEACSIGPVATVPLMETPLEFPWECPNCDEPVGVDGGLTYDFLIRLASDGAGRARLRDRWATT
jgi:hypothetical protein